MLTDENKDTKSDFSQDQQIQKKIFSHFYVKACILWWTLLKHTWMALTLAGAEETGSM